MKRLECLTVVVFVVCFLITEIATADILPNWNTTELALQATNIVIATPSEAGRKSLDGKWKIETILKGTKLKVGEQIDIKTEIEYRLDNFRRSNELALIEPVKAVLFLASKMEKKEDGEPVGVLSARVTDAEGKFYLPIQFFGGYSFSERLNNDSEKSWEKCLEIIAMTVKEEHEFIASITAEDKSDRVKNALEWIKSRIEKMELQKTDHRVSRERFYEQAVAVVNTDGDVADRFDLLKWQADNATRRVGFFDVRLCNVEGRKLVLSQLKQANISESQNSVYLGCLSQNLRPAHGDSVGVRVTAAEQPVIIKAIIPLLDSDDQTTRAFAIECTQSLALLYDDEYETKERRMLIEKLKSMYRAPQYAWVHERVYLQLRYVINDAEWNRLRHEKGRDVVSLRSAGLNRTDFFLLLDSQEPSGYERFSEQVLVKITHYSDDGSRVLGIKNVRGVSNERRVTIPTSSISAGTWGFQVIEEAGEKRQSEQLKMTLPQSILDNLP